EQPTEREHAVAGLAPAAGEFCSQRNNDVAEAIWRLQIDEQAPKHNERDQDDETEFVNYTHRRVDLRLETGAYQGGRMDGRTNGGAYGLVDLLWSPNAQASLTVDADTRRY